MAEKYEYEDFFDKSLIEGFKETQMECDKTIMKLEKLRTLQNEFRNRKRSTWKQLWRWVADIRLSK